jgi:hypothetical protein
MNLLRQASASETRFGQEFCSYANSFAAKQYSRALRSFSPTSKVFIFNRCDSRVLQVRPSEFFVLLSAKVEDAKFKIENSTALFNHGYLFVDGTWISGSGSPILRAADLFSANIDGKIQMLSVIWTLPD